MPSFAAYVAAGALVLLAMDFMAPPAGIGLPLAVWPAMDAGPTQYVDRTHKGDRLTVPGVVDQRLAPAGTPPGVPVGCDPVFSPLSAAARVNFAGRCVAGIEARSTAPS